MDLQIETRLFIGGKYLDPESRKCFADIEPVTEKDLAMVADAGRDDVARAVAAALANSTRYGLAAYLWTSKIDRALRVADRLRTGMVWVNSFFLRDLRTRFGGAQQSRLGRQGGRYSLEFWTEPKLIALAYGDAHQEKDEK